MVQLDNTAEKSGKAKTGLGRGLSALLGTEAEDYASLDKVRTAKEVPVELITPNPNQPRKSFDLERIDELAESVREKGILQPILVRRKPDEPGHYEIIAGERRWRAAQMAKLHTVPVIIKDFTNSEALEVALIENIQRHDLSAIEEAHGYRQLMEVFNHTQEQLSHLVGKSRAHIANLLRLLKLPKEVQEMLGDGRLSMGHARALINAEDPLQLAKIIIEQGLTVRDAEDAAARTRAKGARSGGRSRLASGKSPDTLALEKDLSLSIGLKVDIKDNGAEGGALTIHYQTLEQLDDLCQRLSQQKDYAIA
jgi:ParB family chromosome partitioning protein